jgi:hypothetical protein
MSARKAWPFRGTGLLASARKVKMFPAKSAPGVVKGDRRTPKTIREKFQELQNCSDEWILVIAPANIRHLEFVKNLALMPTSFFQNPGFSSILAACPERFDSLCPTWNTQDFRASTAAKEATENFAILNSRDLC